MTAGFRGVAAGDEPAEDQPAEDDSLQCGGELSRWATAADDLINGRPPDAIVADLEAHLPPELWA